MAIDFKKNEFHLYNNNMSYIIAISRQMDLLNLYYGARIDAEDVKLQTRTHNVACNADDNDTEYSLSSLAQEYPSSGASDFRSPAYEIETDKGLHTPELKYKSHEIIDGKPPIKGLPAVYTENDSEAQTLIITTSDEVHGIEVRLYYTVFKDLNVICRHSEIKNLSNQYVYLNNAQSVSLDFPAGDYEYIHLEGAWAREKHIERNTVHKGTQGFESRRGASGHAENPFLMFFDKGSNEDCGNVYGISLVYSGNHKFMIEQEMYETVRVQAGINPFNFRFKLNKGESFITPETVMVYSSNGFSDMSNTFHKLYRTRLCRGKWRDKARPILINNWEATYFDFNKEKLLAIADTASKIGIELFVLDDGWFGKRDNDDCSLGDWYENKEKLGGTITELADEINKYGLKFGLWFEPEMISPDSDLFRTYPEWAVSVPDVKPHLSRNQLVLDYTREDVREYIVERLTDILSNANIEYVKWDMNRNMSDVYSLNLSAERQGEFYHRYILGLYEILEKITSAFPDILFEGCAGGGGRNDPGMLYYMPQNWASDDTDAVERLYIQYGGSMVYPASTVGAHVSAVPNHQTGRITPLSMRGTVAMNGAFGYELDLSKLSEAELEEMKKQIEFYKKNRELVMSGDYYRLLNPFTSRHSAWMYVSEDKTKVLVYYAVKEARPENEAVYLKLKGLDEKAKYSVNGEIKSGRTLMNYGIVIDNVERDGDNMIFELEAV